MNGAIDSSDLIFEELDFFVDRDCKRQVAPTDFCVKRRNQAILALFFNAKDLHFMDDDGCSAVSTRVLLVEDHEPFRSFIRAFLAKHKELQIVDEAGDGLDAVDKCVELRPALVLLDIGLPGLNGIEAARRIRHLVPACKIIFLTQEASPEVMHEAFNLGASGYVVKLYAATDLIPAITAACEGRQFASRSEEPSRRKARFAPG